MSKTNLNAIESYGYLTTKTVNKLHRELEYIEKTKKGLNGRGKRIRTILDNKPIKEN